jgi:TrmH family RNA methyltransferase
VQRSPGSHEGPSPNGAGTLSPAALRRIFREARRDPQLAVLEGLHALKHALRFGAEISCVAITEPERLRALAETLAPDVLAHMPPETQTLSREAFRTLAPQPPATGVIALARRRPYPVEDLLGDPRAKPVVLLEHPRDLGNLGACVRVAAAADVAGVLSTGVHDPWDPAALRGSAGLHFALPVAHLAEAELQRISGAVESRGHDRPLVALDPDGEKLHPSELPPRAILAFGSERRGLSPELLARADTKVSLPMREGVSSLNLATSVAALLYAWRLS